jgi:hypothetical protein
MILRKIVPTRKRLLNYSVKPFTEFFDVRSFLYSVQCTKKKSGPRFHGDRPSLTLI